jgi:hypothetical protein
MQAEGLTLFEHMRIRTLARALVRAESLGA